MPTADRDDDREALLLSLRRLALPTRPLIVAYCPQVNGEWRASTLNPTYCSGQIATAHAKFGGSDNRGWPSSDKS